MNDSKHKPSAPAYLRKPNSVDVGRISKSIVAGITPVLSEIKGFTAFVAAVPDKLDRLDKAKDVLGSAGAVVEAISEAASSQRRLNDGALRALAGTARHAKAAGQIGFDLVRARIAVSEAQHAVEQFRSPAAASALVFMKPELLNLEAAFGAERQYQLRYRDLAQSLRRDPSRLGSLALEAEKIAGGSKIGRSILQTGRILSHPWLKNGLLTLGMGIAAIKGFHESPSEEVKWKVAQGFGSGVASLVADNWTEVVSKGNLPAKLYDPAVKAILGKEGEKYAFGNFFDDCYKQVGAAIHSYRAHDLTPLNELHKEIMEGKQTEMIRGYALIGEALSRSSLVDLALTKAADSWKGVPADFRRSPSWWEAAKDDLVTTPYQIVQGAAITIGEKLK